MSIVQTKEKLAPLFKLASFVVAAPVWSIAIVASMLPLFIRRKLGVKRRSKPSIIRGPVPIISLKYNSEAERSYGYKSDTLVYGVSRIGQKGDFDYVLSWPSLVPYFVFIWVIWNYDIFCFFFDGGFLANTPLKRVELPLLKFLGKKIVICAYGSDVSMPSKADNKYGYGSAFIKDGYRVDERKVEDDIRYSSKYADYIIAVDALTDFVPHWDSTFHYIPINLDEWQPVYCSEEGEKVKIVHAPNHRALKGTQYLIDVCDLLQKEGYQIDLVLVEKKPNIEARRMYESADIIADQFIGGGQGLFAIEAMALGKPVLGYLREDLFRYHKSWAEIPIVNTNPDNLKENLVKLIENPELRLELGRRGRAYAEKYHSYEYVGDIFDKIYRKLWFGEDIEIDALN